MKASVHFDPVTREWMLFIAEDIGNGFRLLTPDLNTNRLVATEVPRGEDLRPALRGFDPNDLVKALVDAGISPPDDSRPRMSATERHLDDAIATRNRLLALVERKR